LASWSGDGVLGLHTLALALSGMQCFTIVPLLPMLALLRTLSLTLDTTECSGAFHRSLRHLLHKVTCDSTHGAAWAARLTALTLHIRKYKASGLSRTSRDERSLFFLEPVMALAPRCSAPPQRRESIAGEVWPNHHPRPLSADAVPCIPSCEQRQMCPCWENCLPLWRPLLLHRSEQQASVLLDSSNARLTVRTDSSGIIRVLRAFSSVERLEISGGLPVSFFRHFASGDIFPRVTSLHIGSNDSDDTHLNERLVVDVEHCACFHRWNPEGERGDVESLLTRAAHVAAAAHDTRRRASVSPHLPGTDVRSNANLRDMRIRVPSIGFHILCRGNSRFSQFAQDHMEDDEFNAASAPPRPIFLRQQLHLAAPTFSPPTLLSTPDRAAMVMATTAPNTAQPAEGAPSSGAAALPLSWHVDVCDLDAAAQALLLDEVQFSATADTVYERESYCHIMTRVIAAFFQFPQGDGVIHDLRLGSATAAAALPAADGLPIAATATRGVDTQRLQAAGERYADVRALSELRSLFIHRDTITLTVADSVLSALLANLSAGNLRELHCEQLPFRSFHGGVSPLACLAQLRSLTLTEGTRRVCHRLSQKSQTSLDRRDHDRQGEQLLVPPPGHAYC
jgi:hypothetical protein